MWVVLILGFSFAADANEKSQMVQKLKQYGIQAILTKPQDLSVNSINKYFITIIDISKHRIKVIHVSSNFLIGCFVLLFIYSGVDKIF